MPIEKRQTASLSLRDTVQNRRPGVAKPGSDHPEQECLERRYGKVGISAVAAAMRCQAEERSGEQAKDVADGRAQPQHKNSGEEGAAQNGSPKAATGPKANRMA